MNAVKSLKTAQALSFARRRLDTLPSIPAAAIDALHKAGIRTIGDVETRRDKELLTIPWFGSAYLKKTRDAIEAERPHAQKLEASVAVPDVLDRIRKLAQVTSKTDLDAGMTALREIGEVAYRAYTAAVHEQQAAFGSKDEAA